MATLKYIFTCPETASEVHIIERGFEDYQYTVRRHGQVTLEGYSSDLKFVLNAALQSIVTAEHYEELYHVPTTENPEKG